MGAADSAFERTRLASERIARLKRDLGRAEHAAGAGGGRALSGCDQVMAATLGALVPRGWLLLHDVHWPGRPLARLDHVLVGPGGVIVLGAKGWTGKVEVTEGVLRQNGHARHPAIEVALGQAAAVAALLPASRRRVVRSMICIVGQNGFSGTTDAGIEVHGIDSVVAAVAGMPEVLESQAVADVYAQLGRLLTQPQVPEATGAGGGSGRIAVVKNAAARPDIPRFPALPRASTSQPPAVLPSTVRPSDRQPAIGPATPSPQRPGSRSGRLSHGLYSRPRYSQRGYSRGPYSLGRTSLGPEQLSRQVLRSVGIALVASLVSAALLAPPLWLLWELLPK